MLGVAGDEINMKITTRTDIVLADRMLQGGGAGALAGAPSHRVPRRVADPRRRGDHRDRPRHRGPGGRAGAVAEVAGNVRGARRARLRRRSRHASPRSRRAARRARPRRGDRRRAADRPLADTEPAAFAEVIDVNLTGSLNVARSAYPHLRASRGSITFFASSSFTRGRPDYVPYSASKAAVVNLTQGLADEWAGDGIRVNAVSPERTDTPMRRRAFPDEGADGMLSADEVAAATLRLLRSDLTGQVVDVKRTSDLARAGTSRPTTGG